MSQDVAPPEAPAPLRGKLLAGIQQLQAGLLERETEVRNDQHEGQFQACGKTGIGLVPIIASSFVAGCWQRQAGLTAAAWSGSCRLASCSAKLRHAAVAAQREHCQRLLSRRLSRHGQVAARTVPAQAHSNLALHLHPFLLAAGAAAAAGSPGRGAPAAAGPPRHSQVRAQPAPEQAHWRHLLRAPADAILCARGVCSLTGLLVQWISQHCGTGAPDSHVQLHHCSQSLTSPSSAVTHQLYSLQVACLCLSPTPQAWLAEADS